jgi:hypothetical protein
LYENDHLIDSRREKEQAQQNEIEMSAILTFEDLAATKN